MIDHDQLLATMRQCIETDPSGQSLAALVIKEKEAGLKKEDAKRLLLQLTEKYRDAVSKEDSTKEEAVDEVLDRVTGWCSYGLIYEGDE